MARACVLIVTKGAGDLEALQAAFHLVAYITLHILNTNCIVHHG